MTSRRGASGGKLLWPLLATALFALATAGFASAQIHGIPPSVTSIQFHVPPFLPNMMPSVTSLGPHGYGYRAGSIPPPYGIYPQRPAYGRGHKNGYGNYGYGGGYAVPYYVPVYDTSYGVDAGGAGPYLYSGPPAEQTLHIVVDTAPARHDAIADDDYPPPSVKPDSKHANDARPIDSTVLIFRDGHRQEVTNYAIMGHTVYVFDNRTQKIALGDLDLPATIKVNDDRGVDFQLPAPDQS
ncbi:MAG TPA: hypothetical protein VMU45_13515 [Candidatus Eisenbacteria bacterium]|nr:hypothetical protein [Candidatus Eisenbacteria bacterium]